MESETIPDETTCMNDATRDEVEDWEVTHSFLHHPLESGRVKWSSWPTLRGKKKLEDMEETPKKAVVLLETIHDET